MKKIKYEIKIRQLPNKVTFNDDEAVLTFWLIVERLKVLNSKHMICYALNVCTVLTLRFEDVSNEAFIRYSLKSI